VALRATRLDRAAVEARDELRDFVPRNVPQFLGVNLPVAVRQQVPEADDLAPRHLGETLLPLLRQPSRRLADDEHLPLDGGALFVVGGKRLEGHGVGVAKNGLASRDDVRDVEQCVTRHERGPDR
jgi:hypothetical protein